LHDEAPKRPRDPNQQSNSIWILRDLQQNGLTYLQGETDGDGRADLVIRLDGLHTLAQTDFVF